MQKDANQLRSFRPNRFKARGQTSDGPVSCRGQSAVEANQLQRPISCRGQSAVEANQLQRPISCRAQSAVEANQLQTVEPNQLQSPNSCRAQSAVEPNQLQSPISCRGQSAVEPNQLQSPNQLQDKMPICCIEQQAKHIDATKCTVQYKACIYRGHVATVEGQRPFRYQGGLFILSSLSHQSPPRLISLVLVYSWRPSLAPSFPIPELLQPEMHDQLNQEFKIVSRAYLAFLLF